MIDSKTENLLINKEVNKNLENLIKIKLFSNGYIFYGPDGIGKKQTALKFIEDIFKLYSSSSNINEKILDNNHPDFLLIEPTYIINGKSLNRSSSELNNKNNKETIKIDQIRDIKKFLGQKSIDSEKKIVLIIDAHLLNEAASNCLLKTLEEPTNGIFILLTSKLNLIKDTIISRCQLIRFKSFSYKEIECFIKDNLNIQTFDFDKESDFSFLINSANGSPGKVLDNIKIWSDIPKEIRNQLNQPIRDYLEILKVARFVSKKLEIYQQIFLINFIQRKWWHETKNIKIIEKLEILKKYLKGYIQPQLAWEVTLLNVASEN